MRKSIAAMLLVLTSMPLYAKKHEPIPPTQEVLDTYSKMFPAKFFVNQMSYSPGAGAFESPWCSMWIVKDELAYGIVTKNQCFIRGATIQGVLDPMFAGVTLGWIDDKGKLQSAYYVIKRTQPLPTAQTPAATPKTVEPPAPTVVAQTPAPSAAALASPPAAAQAVLNIDSAPSEADIEIDGLFVGNTPSTVSAAPGIHKISVKKKGFTDWNKTINVTDGSVHIKAELETEPVKQ